MVHALKIKSEYFKVVLAYNKNFEVRKNDRDFQVGDFVALNEIDDEGNYTGSHAVRKITYILNDEQYLAPGYVALGLRCVDNEVFDYKTSRKERGKC